MQQHFFVFSMSLPLYIIEYGKSYSNLIKIKLFDFWNDNEFWVRIRVTDKKTKYGESSYILTVQICIFNIKTIDAPNGIRKQFIDAARRAYQEKPLKKCLKKWAPLILHAIREPTIFYAVSVLRCILFIFS